MIVQMFVLDFDASYAYVPPKVKVLINSDFVMDVKPCEGRGPGLFCKITLSDGRSYVVPDTVDSVYYDLWGNK